jgi:hypothetical protein
MPVIVAAAGRVRPRGALTKYSGLCNFYLMSDMCVRGFADLIIRRGVNVVPASYDVADRSYPSKTDRGAAILPRCAFVDEAQSVEAHGSGTYLLTATICDYSILPAERATIETLRRRGAHKLHWHDEGAKRRRTIAETIALMPLRHVVVIRHGYQGELPERGRRHCMERLLYELDQVDVSTVIFESRGPKDDRRDRDMHDALRARRIVRPTLRMEHAPGPREPMLWVPDAVCGAAMQHRNGDPTYLDIIQEQSPVQVLRIGRTLPIL